ncbi:MAG: polysaccharide deacetylase family protein, partial [Terriglobales bacterium]
MWAEKSATEKIKFCKGTGESLLNSGQAGMPIVLLYHSIDDRCGRPDCWSLTVSPENFSAQMEALSLERTVISLSELERQVRRGRVHRGTAVVTFDDGYANNGIVAQPILERLGIPATLFLATGMVGSSEFWWDRLERILTDATRRPEKLEIEIGSHTVEVSMENWTNEDLLIKIWTLLRDVAPVTRDTALQYLEEALAALPRHLSRPLMAEEVGKLRAGPIEVGAHTVTHPWLPVLEPDTLARELHSSKLACEEFMGCQVTAFSYPFGVYNEASRSQVISNGFSSACATINTFVPSNCDVFALPRVA